MGNRIAKAIEACKLVAKCRNLRFIMAELLAAGRHTVADCRSTTVDVVTLDHARCPEIFTAPSTRELRHATMRSFIARSGDERLVLHLTVAVWHCRSEGLQVGKLAEGAKPIALQGVVGATIEVLPVAQLLALGIHHLLGSK